MKNKQIGLLLVVPVFCLCMGIGLCFMTDFFPVHKNIFQLQNEYAQHLEKKVVRLLEPATGIGNVRATINAQITHKNITKTHINFQNQTRTISQETGPVLLNQSVSVLINEKDKNKFYAYQNLVKNAIGFDPKRGDKLTVELLPFVKIPLWTLGLTPICLMRIGAILALALFCGIAWLCREWMRLHEKKAPFVPSPDKTLWKKAEDIPAYQWGEIFPKIPPETGAFLLFHFGKEKSAQIIDLLPIEYTKQVILHLNHIEKLSFAEQNFLLQSTESYIKKTLDTLAMTFPFDQVKTWQHIDIPQLLQYVSKKDLINALKTAPQVICHLFQNHIPPLLWQELSSAIATVLCSDAESQTAKEKIMQTVHLLQENE